MSALRTDGGPQGAVLPAAPTQARDERDAARLDTPEQEAPLEGRGSRSMARLVHLLTLAALAALIFAVLLSGTSAVLYAALAVAPLGDLLASWLRRRERAKAGAR